MPQDFTRNYGFRKDLASNPLQLVANKRPPQGEGGGGGIPSPVEIPLCEHTKPDGVRCGSPARRGKTRCYYHLHPNKMPRPKAPTVLPDLTNPMQMLRWAIHNLEMGSIDTKTAGQIIYAVQQIMR